MTLLSTLPWPFPIHWLPKPAYLVGGALRDQIRRQHSDHPQPWPSQLDLDLVLERDSVQWASDTARRLQGGFVVLDPERQIARIVLKQATLDVAQQVGGSLEADLRHRDFTCNAIALELHSQTLIDPLQGAAAIAQRQIRMVHPDNLSADPLRLLRAYRQAAQLEFDLDPETHQQIQAKAPQLQQVAAERVRTEICYLLAVPQTGIAYLHQAWQDGLLSGWLPYLSPQGFALAQAADQLLPCLQQQYPRTFGTLQAAITEDRPLWFTVLCAALLQGDPSVEQTLDQLRFSRAERQAAQKLHRLLPKFRSLVSQNTTTLNPGQYYLFYEAAATLFPAVVLLAQALGVPTSELRPWLDRYEDPQDPLAHQIPLVDGRQVMQALGKGSGPWVGQVLAAIRLAQAEGEITTPIEALQYAQRWTPAP